MGRWRAIRILALVAALASPAAAQDTTIVPMGTGAVTGAYFPVGVALCRLVNQHRRETGLRCAAQPSAEGSVANIAGLRDGALDLAIVQSDVQAEALAGTGAFAEAGPFADLRAVMALYPEPLTLVARADAGIAQVEDLAGKRVGARRRRDRGTRAIADALMARPRLDAGQLRRRAGPRRPTGWPTRSATARSTPSSTPSAIRRWSSRRRPPPATRCSSTPPAPRSRTLVASRPYFVAATIPAGLYRGTRRAVDDLRGRRHARHPRRACPRTPIHTIVRGGLRRLRDAARPRSGARRPRSRADDERGPVGAAASRRRALLPRAGLDRVAWPSIAISSAWRPAPPREV